MSKRFAPLLLALPLAALGNDDPTLRDTATRLFGRIEAPSPDAVASPQAALGRALFWDKRISLDGATSCASCHPAEDHGADRRRLSVDARGELTPRNSPTVFNAMAFPGLRWLADRKTGAEQAEGSMTGSLGFATKNEAVARVAALGYGDAFKAAFPGEAEPLTAKNYGRAIEAYERTLATPADFDRFLAGDDRALTERQKAGLRAFIAVGCAGCHSGPHFGGATLRKFGLAKDYWIETGARSPDPGRYAVTKKEEDRFVFRVASLRNVARTAPYFHDGSVDTLEHAVKVMASVQLGRDLDPDTIALIAAFLESLTGEVPAHYAAPKKTGA